MINLSLTDKTTSTGFILNKMIYLQMLDLSLTDRTTSTAK